MFENSPNADDETQEEQTDKQLIERTKIERIKIEVQNENLTHAETERLAIQEGFKPNRAAEISTQATA